MMDMKVPGVTLRVDTDLLDGFGDTPDRGLSENRMHQTIASLERAAQSMAAAHEQVSRVWQSTSTGGRLLAGTTGLPPDVAHARFAMDTGRRDVLTSLGNEFGLAREEARRTVERAARLPSLMGDTPARSIAGGVTVNADAAVRDIDRITAAIERMREHASKPINIGGGDGITSPVTNSMRAERAGIQAAQAAALANLTAQRMAPPYLPSSDDWGRVGDTHGPAPYNAQNRVSGGRHRSLFQGDMPDSLRAYGYDFDRPVDMPYPRNGDRNRRALPGAGGGGGGDIVDAEFTSAGGDENRRRQRNPLDRHRPLDIMLGGGGRGGGGGGGRIYGMSGSAAGGPGGGRGSGGRTGGGSSGGGFSTGGYYAAVFGAWELNAALSASQEADTQAMLAPDMPTALDARIQGLEGGTGGILGGTLRFVGDSVGMATGIPSFGGEIRRGRIEIERAARLDQLRSTLGESRDATRLAQARSTRGNAFAANMEQQQTMSRDIGDLRRRLSSLDSSLGERNGISFGEGLRTGVAEWFSTRSQEDIDREYELNQFVVSDPGLRNQMAVEASAIRNTLLPQAEQRQRLADARFQRQRQRQVQAARTGFAGRIPAAAGRDIEAAFAQLDTDAAAGLAAAGDDPVMAGLVEEDYRSRTDTLITSTRRSLTSQAADLRASADALRSGNTFLAQRIGIQRDTARRLERFPRQATPYLEDEYAAVRQGIMDQGNARLEQVERQRGYALSDLRATAGITDMQLGRDNRGATLAGIELQRQQALRGVLGDDQLTAATNRLFDSRTALQRQAFGDRDARFDFGMGVAERQADSIIGGRSSEAHLRALVAPLQSQAMQLRQAGRDADADRVLDLARKQLEGARAEYGRGFTTQQFSSFDLVTPPRPSNSFGGALDSIMGELNQQQPSRAAAAASIAQAALAGVSAGGGVAGVVAGAGVSGANAGMNPMTGGDGNTVADLLRQLLDKVERINGNIEGI
ncbi:MAG: hypothetical protein AAGD32_06640 [Planctomycetota bacterium]